MTQNTPHDESLKSCRHVGQHQSTQKVLEQFWARGFWFDSYQKEIIVNHTLKMFFRDHIWTFKNIFIFEIFFCNPMTLCIMQQKPIILQTISFCITHVTLNGTMEREKITLMSRKIVKFQRIFIFMILIQIGLYLNRRRLIQLRQLGVWSGPS